MRLRRLVGLLPLLLAACSGEREPVEPLRLIKVTPRHGVEELRLNDDIRFTFSEPIDSTSVTADSVRIADVANGKLARGDWDVEGRTLRFRPRGVRTAGLENGGYAPGATYEVTLVGFPSIGAVRSIDGASLSRTLSARFDIVPTKAADGRPVLRDATPDRTAPLRIDPVHDGASRSRPLGYDEWLRLSCAEPLDPRTLDPAEFEIVRTPLPRDIPGSDPEPVRIVRLYLERNEDEDAPGAALRPRAILRVVPAGPLPLADGALAREFVLRRRPTYGGPGLRDFSGGRAWQAPIPFFVIRVDAVAPERTGVYEFEFDDDFDFAPVLDPSSDGTALWTDTGRVQIRYPAAAGDGHDRATVLDGAVDATDVQATRLTIAEGTVCDLTPPASNGSDDRPSSAGGLVVLRAQGRIDLAGTLRRRLPEGYSPPPMWARRSDVRTPPDWDTSRTRLSDWLDEARERDLPWTVVVAGGDLVVTGDIDVDTPLLLVAGGRIRGSGRPRAASGQLWLLGEGGGFVLEHQIDPRASPFVVPPLVIDEPLENPLVENLVFVAISSKAPKGARPRFWGPPVVVSSGGSHGSARVQYLRGDALSRGEEGLGQAVRHNEPNGVVEPGSPGSRVQLRIELVARPGKGPWRPPFVDRVRLTWSPEPR